MNDVLGQLFSRLNEPLHRYAELDRYYTGTQPLAFLAPDARDALDGRFGVMCSNIPRLAVTALAERLRITGLAGDDQLWSEWVRNDLDLTSGTAHREALLLGDSYVIVWADTQGRPQVSVESAKQVACLTDPGSRQTYAAIKRWEDPDRKTTEATMFLPDRVVRLRADQLGAVAAGFKVIGELDNPLGVVPVVGLRNSDRIESHCGTSEITDLKPLVDALNKALADAMVSSEYTGRPRRWATGIELTEEPVLDEAGNETGETVEVNPIPEGDRAMISENDAAKFGQLAGADLGGYEALVRVILGQIMAVSALPGHYLGVLTDTPASADAIRAAEASLTARAEDRQRIFGRSWEWVGKLMLAVRDKTTPDRVPEIRVRWADAATRSVAQEADAVVKLHQAGILPTSYALKRLGYSDDEIAEINVARSRDAVANVDLTKVLGR